MTDHPKDGNGNGDSADERPLAHAVRSAAERVAATSSALRELGTERIARAIATAAQSIARLDSPLGREARVALVASTGLSLPMVDWALETALAPATPDALLALAARSLRPPRDGAIPSPATLVVVVLAGNVFTAAFRALALPLLAGAPTIAKAPSNDDVLPRFFLDALREADATVAASLEVLTFAGGDEDLEDALFAQADTVAIYGSDATVAAIRGRLHGTSRVVVHGHGLGAIWVPRDALHTNDDLLAFAKHAALDIAAYDQRGCLSPHAVLVEPGGTFDVATIARSLADHGLTPLATSLSRGPLPRDVASAQLMWRGVAAARGDVFDGGTWCVSLEGDAALRVSPGWRNVSVLGCASHAALVERLRPFGVHLKALGVAGAAEIVDRTRAALPSPLAPRVCAVGEMQTPPLDALADGEPPFNGLVRWLDC